MDTHCASGASVRLAKTPKFDWDGWLSFTTFLDRWQYSESAELGSLSGARSMSAATRRSSFSETVLTGRCYFNVQRYLSPAVSVHIIFFRLSISGELRTIDSSPEACTCTFVKNLELAGHSAIVKRKKEKST